MSLLDQLVARPVPLQSDEHGVIRVGGTRVRLDTVIGAYENGCCPEEIRLKYPSLALTDIYAVLTYYLWHRPEVDSYLDERRRVAKEVQRENETKFPPEGLRERLQTRGTTKQ